MESSAKTPVPPVGKDSLVGTTSSLHQHCGSLCGNPYSDLTLWGFQGAFLGLNHWESDCDREEGRSLQEPAYRS